MNRLRLTHPDGMDWFDYFPHPNRKGWFVRQKYIFDGFEVGTAGRKLLGRLQVQEDVNLKQSQGWRLTQRS
jgi:hypothetical protein